MKLSLLLVILCFCSTIYAPDNRLPQFSNYQVPSSLWGVAETNPASKAAFAEDTGECVDLSTEITAQEAKFSKYIGQVNPRLSEEERLDLAQLFAATGQHAEILLAMAAVESEFRVKVTGDRGTSIGMMQVNKDWYRKICRRPAASYGFNPRVNLHVADVLVQGLDSKFHRIAPRLTEELRLQAVVDGYNRGDERAYQALKSGDLPTRHVTKVMRRYEQLKAL